MKGEEARKEKEGVERHRKNGGGKNTDDYLTTSNHTQEQNEYLRDVLTLLVLIDTTLLVQYLTYSLLVP